MNTVLIKNKYDDNKMKLYLIDYDFKEFELDKIVGLILNRVTHEYFINDNLKFDNGVIFVKKKYGVTDDEARILESLINENFNTGRYNFVSSIDIIKKDNSVLSKYNPVIYDFFSSFNSLISNRKYEYDNIDEVEIIDIFSSDKKLEKISLERHLALNLQEMKAIKKHCSDSEVKRKRAQKGLKGLTDCEIEIIAQTWSEHCKHKEFNAIIEYYDSETGEKETINGLFGTFIKRTTKEVNENLGENNFLLKVFDDNSGVVRIDENTVFTFKVETHNSPSAIDPYGGALTGILGNNRDPLGTGKGGGELIFNTDVLCFASSDFSKKLLKKQNPPEFIKNGVVNGIKDGGNKVGVPTINGSIVYDDNFSGKPLVFCGTGGIMPIEYINGFSYEKEIKAGYVIYMLGGRVGKDGIHGATFSSRRLDDASPVSAVQIGSPFTQKKAMDFLKESTLRGLIEAVTDNGAGGLSSSVGELALLSGGAKVFLERVPLKYEGLKPWEIFVSESQERFTLAVKPENKEEIKKLADFYDTELTDIGVFTDEGYLEVYYKGRITAYLELEFLHNGVPEKVIDACWSKPEYKEPDFNEKDFDYKQIIKNIFKADNVKSKEDIVRQYDHEVKGNTVLKPYMGETLKAPQDAGVVRLGINDKRAIIVTNGINPKYGYIDAYDMSCSAFDEAVRSVISVGGKLPQKDLFWSVNDNFCMPNIIFDKKNNPDGKYKAAQLVKMCKALYDVGTYFNIPFTSGKDSMKNDFYSEGVKISIPPTVLYSVAAYMENIDYLITSDFKNEGDLIYQLGETYDEMGGSEFFKLFGYLGNSVPKLRFKEAKELYQMFMKASELKLIESSHDISDGGMIVSLIESCLGNTVLGVNIDIGMFNLPVWKTLFSESNSRFIVSIKKESKELFESIFKNRAYFLGYVTNDGKITIYKDKRLVTSFSKKEIFN